MDVVLNLRHHIENVVTSVDDVGTLQLDLVGHGLVRQRLDAISGVWQPKLDHLVVLVVIPCWDVPLEQLLVVLEDILESGVQVEQSLGGAERCTPLDAALNGLEQGETRAVDGIVSDVLKFVGWTNNLLECLDDLTLLPFRVALEVRLKNFTDAALESIARRTEL